MLNHIDIKYFKLAVGSDNIGKETNVDITARCPVCGDSRTNKRLKRLHLYTKNDVTNVNCFNGDCAVHNKTMYTFLLKFSPKLFDDYKAEKFKNNIKNLGKVEDVFSDIKNETKLEKPLIITNDLSSSFEDISNSRDAINYLENRGILYNDSYYGKWYFGTKDLDINGRFYKLTNFIIIPIYYCGEMYGFYSRNIYEKMFSTYMHEANVGYKLWNFFNIDNDKPVYIFEGIFDAVSSKLENVIALLGATIPDDRLREIKSPVFVLDNDKTGILNSIKYARLGHSVFVQPEKYNEKDMNELLLNHNNLNVLSLIHDNLYTSIAAEVRLKAKL